MQKLLNLSDLFFKEEAEYEEEAKEVLAGETVPEVLKAFFQELDQLETLKLMRLRQP